MPGSNATTTIFCENYEVACLSTGEVYSFRVRNSEIAAGAALVALEAGRHADRALQASWTAHGAGGHVVRVMESAKRRAAWERAGALRAQRDAARLARE